MGQVVNFVTGKGIDAGSLTRGLNSLLPRDIRVRDGRDAACGFHARYSAKSKTYVYCMLNQPYNSPFLSRYVLHAPYSLDIASMREAIRLILGMHDFSAFKKKDEVYKSPVREVMRAGVATKGQDGIRDHRGDRLFALYGAQHRGDTAARGTGTDRHGRLRPDTRFRTAGAGRPYRPSPGIIPKTDKVLVSWSHVFRRAESPEKRHRATERRGKSSKLCRPVA